MRCLLLSWLPLELAAEPITYSVKSLISHVEERDPVVKAWAFFDPELVLKSARALDAIPPAERGPLHGVCVGVKDVIFTKDMPTQHNSPIYKDSQAGIDAACVKTLRSAGALIFGKTQTTEFATCQKGTPACNPHDPTRTPGGSSSGSGAAVGDYQCTISLGSESRLPCPLPSWVAYHLTLPQPKPVAPLFVPDPSTASTPSSRHGTRSAEKG